MKKNIIVLIMSTLRATVQSYRFSYKKDDEKGTEYYSQLEPVSKMILEREGSLDKIIILATEATKEKKEFILESEEKTEKRNCSAIDFYKERMGLENEEKVEIVDLNEEKFTPAIFDTVEIIRSIYAEKEPGDEFKLWIDTQGGFRNLTLVMNAIISLLKSDNIEPSGIYSVQFDRNKKLQKINDETKTYKIFQFVSGINEFSRYGRAEQLEDYYNSICSKKIPKIVRRMKNITEAIQMCNMIEFEEHLRGLRNLVENRIDASEKNLLNIFWKQIENDYGPLLEESCTGLDIVEWFYKKKFYQQAITYIEAKLPKEWVERGILSYKINKDEFEKLKKEIGKTYIKDNKNLVFDQIGLQYFRWSYLVRENNGKRIKTDKFNNRSEFAKSRTDKYRAENKWWNMDVVYLKKVEDKDTGKTEYKEEKIGTMDVAIKKGVNADTVMDMILLYKLLKNERNKFNHMSDKNDRADQLLLGKVIRLFIECGREVYGD